MRCVRPSGPPATLHISFDHEVKICLQAILDLAIFYLSVGSKPADKAEDFTAANINSVKLAARATGDMSEKNLPTESFF